MTLQYISDSSGQVTAVIIAISDWNALRSRYPDIDATDHERAQWQKDITEQRLQFMNDNSGRSIPPEVFNRELNAGLQEDY